MVKVTLIFKDKGIEESVTGEMIKNDERCIILETKHNVYEKGKIVDYFIKIPKAKQGDVKCIKQ